MRNRKNLLLTFLVTLAAFALIGRGMATSDSTTLSVTPQTSTGAVGDTFSINIYITNVTNLWGYEFLLWYNPSVLTAINSTPSADFPDVSFNYIDYPGYEGSVWVAASLPMGPPEGLDGSMTLVAIEFSVEAIGESTLDIDEDYTVLIGAAGQLITPTIVDGYFTTAEVKVHDIAIISVTVSPTKVAPGDSVSINVKVANEGDFAETFNVTVSYDGTVIGTETDVSLAVGGNTTTSFTWDTTGVEAGIYTISAEALVDQDNDLVNNIDTATVTIGAVHDIAVTSVTVSPTKVAPGDSVSINVKVANEGDFAETFNVTVSYDGTVIGTETDVSLAVGGNTTVTFSWDTEGLPGGPYLIRAEAIVDEDDGPANNTFDAGIVTIEEGEAKGEAQVSDFFLYVAAAAGIVIVTAAVGFYILRVRKPKPT